MRGEDVAKAVDNSELYGSFGHSAYRNLVTYDFEEHDKPRIQFNKQLVIALSDALNCSVSDLATDVDLSQIRDVPYRRAQWPQFMLDEMYEVSPRTSVTAPTTTAKRIVAYSRQHAYNNATELASRMRDYGYSISSRNMRYVWDTGNTEPQHAQRLSRIVTFEFCEAVATVFRGRMGRNLFSTEWLLRCQDRCPHCNPIYLDG